MVAIAISSLQLNFAWNWVTHWNWLKEKIWRNHWHKFDFIGIINIKWTFFEGVRRYGKNRSSLHSWYWNPMDYPRTKKMQFNHWKEMSDLRKEHQDVHFHFSTISVSKYKLQLILEWVLCWLLSQFIYIFHQFQFREAA